MTENKTKARTVQLTLFRRNCTICLQPGVKSPNDTSNKQQLGLPLKWEFPTRKLHLVPLKADKSQHLILLCALFSQKTQNRGFSPNELILIGG
jgi:hypothetical protein